MKKILIIFSVFITFFSSCTKDGADLLDPPTERGLIDAFGDAQRSEQFLMNIYSQILPVLQRTDGAGSRWRANYLLEVGTENGASLRGDDARLRDWYNGATTPNSTDLFSFADWRDNYNAIRACYIFLENIDNVPLEQQYSEETRAIRKAEAKWLLAFNYAELAKEFGGLPLIDRLIDPDEDITIPRSTYDETINFIVKLLDEAAVGLPREHPANELGRATKGAALALKARMLLYAASPLWNDPSNPTDSPFHGTYDVEKWKKAVEAARDVISLQAYELHDDLSTLFTTRTNSEIIFARMQEPMAYFTATNVPYKLYHPGAYAIGGNTNVTYNMIKEYEVLNGGVAYSVDDPLSNHNFNDPYKNRDPRFYRDCIYNGAKLFLGTAKTAEFGEVANGVSKTPAHNFPVSPTSNLNTYVYSVKFADLTLNVTWNDPRSAGAGARTNQNYPYLRYAEVLLNYAEAVNEAYGPEIVPPGGTLTALQALNQVRTRAQYVTDKPEYLGQTGGMPPVAGGISKDEFRAKLQHERRVEFSFEEHWFWDFRRWKLTPDNEIKAQIPVWTSPNTVVYQIRTTENRYWDPKMYRMPIPEVEIQLNPNLVQNPGW